MKRLRLLLAGLICLNMTNSQAQTNTPSGILSYNIEAFGSAGSGDYTPFWIVSNRFGLVPLESGNGYLRTGAFYNGIFGRDFYWGAGVDLVGVAPRYKNVYIHQVYAEIGFQALLLSIGSKERYTSLWDKRLSSGDMVLSPNARPIPEINLSMTSFTVIPFTGGWAQVKGDFALGRSFDTGYLEQFVNDKQVYNKETLWHHKSLYLRVKDTKNDFPLSFAFGVQHWAQWGGTSTDPKIGKHPQSLKDFMRVVVGKEGGEGASVSDSINVLGNHYGSYDFKLSFIRENWAVHAYHQRYFEDKSGMEFKNGFDGIWGIQADLPRFSWVQKIVFEFFDTRNQTGPMHFIDFDRDKYSGLGGGNDNYYNNGEYTTGTSYFNRSLGSPLLPSPEYNTDGSLGFKNNRIRSWHMGFEGVLSSQVDYRVLVTAINSWGTYNRPFLNRKNNGSGLIEITYRHPRLSGWFFTGAFSADKGSMFDGGIGFSLCVAKRGLFNVGR